MIAGFNVRHFSLCVVLEAADHVKQSTEAQPIGNVRFLETITQFGWYQGTYPDSLV